VGQESLPADLPAINPGDAAYSFAFARLTIAATALLMCAGIMMVLSVRSGTL
jgi:hypothetical protein